MIFVAFVNSFFLPRKEGHKLHVVQCSKEVIEVAQGGVKGVGVVQQACPIKYLVTYCGRL